MRDNLTLKTPELRRVSMGATTTGGNLVDVHIVAAADRESLEALLGCPSDVLIITSFFSGDIPSSIADGKTCVISAGESNIACAIYVSESMLARITDVDATDVSESLLATLRIDETTIRILIRSSTDAPTPHLTSLLLSADHAFVAFTKSPWAWPMERLTGTPSETVTVARLRCQAVSAAGVPWVRQRRVQRTTTLENACGALLTVDGRRSFVRLFSPTLSLFGTGDVVDAEASRTIAAEKLYRVELRLDLPESLGCVELRAVEPHTLVDTRSSTCMLGLKGITVVALTLSSAVSPEILSKSPVVVILEAEADPQTVVLCRLFLGHEKFLSCWLSKGSEWSEIDATSSIAEV